MCQELLKARTITWPHCVSNRSTVLFERELRKIDHPLTTLHQEDVDPYVNMQLQAGVPLADHDTHLHTTGEHSMSLHATVETLPSMVHARTPEVKYDVEFDMPSTGDLLAALEPVIIIEDFPVAPPFWVSDLLSPNLDSIEQDPETPCLSLDSAQGFTCATQVHRTDDATSSTLDAFQAGKSEAFEHPTASEAGTHRDHHSGTVECIRASDGECVHTHASEAGKRSFECHEIRLCPSDSLSLHPPVTVTVAGFEHQNDVHQESFQAKVSALSSVPMKGCATEERQPVHMPMSITALTPAANRDSIKAVPCNADHLIGNEDSKELENSQRKGRKDPRCEEEDKKQPAYQTPGLGQNTQQPAVETRKLPLPMSLQAMPGDFPTAPGPSLTPQTMSALSSSGACADLTNPQTGGSALPAIDIAEGSAKSVHNALFANHLVGPGKTSPQIEVMTTAVDPLTLNDPWKRAAELSDSKPCNAWKFPHGFGEDVGSEKRPPNGSSNLLFPVQKTPPKWMPNPTGNLACNALNARVYSDQGGIHQFANRKRAASHEEELPAKKANLSQPPVPTHPLQHDQHESTPCHAKDQFQDDSINVWIGYQSNALTKVKIPVGTTIGQVAVAESKLVNLPDPVRPLSAMGSTIPVYHEVKHNQIVFLEDGGFDHEAQYPEVSHLNRQDALWQQQGWVADDEMCFYLNMIGKPNLAHTTAPLIMNDDPDDILHFDHWINEVLELIDQSEANTVHTACLHKRHWFPISVHQGPDMIHITTTLTALPTVKHWATEAMGNMFQFHYKVAHEVFPADCGFQTIAWIMAQELGDSNAYPMSVEHAIGWREQFACHLLNCNHYDSPADSLLFGGMTDHKLTELAALLQQHGVKADRVNSLVAQLVQNLGFASIQSTLGAARPWADLKAKASALQPPIKLVLSDELQAQIANRLQTGKPMGSKKNKQPKKHVQPQWTAPSASQVQIPDGIFQQQDGTPLGQITLHQLQTSHRGIAVLNIQDAKPFFNLQRPLSPEGIGLLVLDFRDETLPSHHQVIRFPASCPDTQEPMILSAALIQLGQMPVHRTLPPKPTSIDQVETVVVRAVLYRDQCNFPWSHMQTKPVKALLEMEHFASMSKGDLLDVWDRQFLSKQYQKLKADEAELFSVVLRPRSSCIDALMSLNSKDGLFFEPRTQSGRGPCPESRVVWLPRQSFHDVLIAKQATQLPASIARSGDRYGLRTKTEHASTIHAQHRPDVAYLDGTNTKTFRIAPLPFGSTKESLQKVFDTWEWKARPSHTQGLTADRQGLVWIAHATTQPNFFIFTMEHGDVLISEVPNHKPLTLPSQGAPVASVRTLRHLSATAAAAPNAEAKGMVDPLQTNDPWASQDTHVYLWRQPKPLPWNDHQGPLPEDHFQLPEDVSPEDSSISIAKELESRLHESLQKQNKPGLQPQQRGRCQTMESQKILSHARPIKPSRHGDVQPEYQGDSLQHQRWFTQLRRFESLARLYRAMPWSQSQHTHAHREWRAILKAPGFSNFRNWWKNLQSKRPDAPDVLPDALPSETALSAMCLTLHEEVRRFESMLQAELIAKAKMNRIMQPNRIFKDFAKPVVSPVCILQDSVQATIKSVDPNDCSVTLETEASFWPGEVITDTGPTTPIITCEDQMWLESVDGLQPGQSIRQ
eukprot:s4965_g2.t1